MATKKKSPSKKKSAKKSAKKPTSTGEDRAPGGATKPKKASAKAAKKTPKRRGKAASSSKKAPAAASATPPPAPSQDATAPAQASKPPKASQAPASPEPPPPPQASPPPEPPPEPQPAAEPEAPRSKTGLATTEELQALLTKFYPRDLRPESVGYFLSPEWTANLQARHQAEQGQRFFETMVEAIEAATGLDIIERLGLVDRPAFLLRVLLHPGKRFPGPRLSDNFLQDLGGEARILDLWVSALGPFYYAKGYRLWPSLKEDLEGRPPPLDRTDPVALKAMRTAARELKRIGFRRVPGAAARAAMPGIRVPGQLIDEAPTIFDLLFDAAPVATPPADERPFAAHERRDRETPRAKPAYQPDEEILEPQLKREIDLEIEVFQQELEDDLEKLQEEIDRARRTRR